MRKRTSAINHPPVRVVIVTLDAHLASAAEAAHRALSRSIPNLHLSLHAAAEWANDETALARCREDIARGDIIVVTMLFLDEHIRAVLPDLEARRAHCDAMVCCLSAGEVLRLTRMGRFDMTRKDSGAIAWLKRLRGAARGRTSSGAKQMAMLRRLPRLLRFVPGTAQDVRVYFLVMQYWLACSSANLENLLRELLNRYAAGPRRALCGTLAVAAPEVYPDNGVYHPRLRGRIAESVSHLPRRRRGNGGTVGLLVMRSYVLAGNTAHYDGVIEALEARGMDVIPVFACGLDMRPAIEAYFFDGEVPRVDAVLSLTGFSLVGGPAYNDAGAAEAMLARLDVPYLTAHAIEFQNLEQWEASPRGLMPLEATMMVAIPELDGATGPIVFGGRSAAAEASGSRDMRVHAERADMLARRVARLVSLRRKARSERRVAIVLFNFPPNAGSVGSAAYLDVFASLLNTLRAMAAAGYEVGELPADPDALRTRIVEGNAAVNGADANVCARVPVDDYVRRETWLAEIEAQWGPAPGRHQVDGDGLRVLGERFGNVLVGVQPAFGYEGDPMRLLFEQGFAPTHAFAAFYRYLRETFAADVCLHFGTHGALEFMPGKQAGLSAGCWPDRLIGDLPNVYFYAANNPSEGALARRRTAATLVSYLTPPLSHAGLYRELNELKATLARWHEQGGKGDAAVVELLSAQAAGLDLPPRLDEEPAERWIARLSAALVEIETTLIPCGLHVAGEGLEADARAELIGILNESGGTPLPAATISAVAAGATLAECLKAGAIDPDDDALRARVEELAGVAAGLAVDGEIPGLLHALDAGYVRPVAGGDLLRNPGIVPTGRNIHGFDPFRIPSAWALLDGARQAERLLASHQAQGNELPESIALVLWGSDSIKNEGGPIGQALALLGARPRLDSYGRLCGAELMSLEELGRPRIDVVMTVSGIFRDLLPLQMRVLAEACLLAAAADEPESRNFVRKHAIAYQQAHGCELETAALRVFSNADGAYGANVNHLIESGCWQDEDELAETFTHRKCFAYAADGSSSKHAALFDAVLGQVDLAYQNLESAELGITTIDHYFDTLGGIGRAVVRARGRDVPVYIGDQTSNEARVRTLADQVALETRTRMLNPKWYEGMLAHGFEGVRSIEAQLTNTLGWSATTGQVAPWIYQQISQTFILDPAMRERLAALNPGASARLANRLLEAQERSYWSPDDTTLEALREAGDELEDRLEGIIEGVAA